MSALERLVARRSKVLPRLVGRLGQGRLVQQQIEAANGPLVRIGGRWILNFASTNYLGLNESPQVMRAGVDAVRRWGTSLGMPRLLATDRLTLQVEDEIAHLVQQERALIFPSTTHVALDVLPHLAGPHGILLVDDWAYPISMEGARLARQRGARILRIPHNNLEALATALHANRRNPDKVIVCDGVYPPEGRPAPLRKLDRLARSCGAVIYVDDAHGIGVLGEEPTERLPYGRGGGGTPTYCGLTRGNVVHVGSLSKAFGVPLAFVAGPAAYIRHLEAIAATYTHSSPPAIPLLAAALAALRINTSHGDALRHHLLGRIQRFHMGLDHPWDELLSNHRFPIQTLCFPTARAAEDAGRMLRRHGLWAVLQFGPPDCPKGGVLRFVLSAWHRDQEVDTLVRAVRRLIQMHTGRTRRSDASLHVPPSGRWS